MRLLFPIVWAIACTGEVNDAGPTFGTPDGTVDSSGGDDTEEATEPPGDDAGTRFTGLSHELHPSMGSLVYVQWEQSQREPVRVEYSFDPGIWRSTPVFDGESGFNQHLLVGIPFSSEQELVDNGAGEIEIRILPRQVIWRVVADRDGTAAQGTNPIVMGEVDPGLPIPELVYLDEANAGNADAYLLTSINQDPGGWTGGQYWVVIYDRQGRPVWARRVPNRHWSLFPQVSSHRGAPGHLLWDESTRWSNDDDGIGSKIHRTYLDEEIEIVPAPGLHHAFVQLPDGTLAWGSQAPMHGPGEALVERSPGQPNETIRWSCEGTDAPLPELEGCVSSGLWFDESQDTYLLSFTSHDAVVAVERASAETSWWAGGLPGSYSVFPAPATLRYPHSPSFTATGNLLVSAELVLPGVGNEELYTTVVREYEVRDDTQELVEVWSYDAYTHAVSNGHAARLANGNTLHVLGSASEVKEVDRLGRPVWHLDFRGSRLLGRGELIEDLYDLVKPHED